MHEVGIWHVTRQGLKRLQKSELGFEQYLEYWIERDPALLSDGLAIVGRRLMLHGNRLDLLALDSKGVWVVVKIVTGAVTRDNVAQAIEHASYIATLPYHELSQKVDEYLGSHNGRATSLERLLAERNIPAETSDTFRELLIFVVGRGRTAGLERMVGYLSGRYGLPIQLVSYDIFETMTGHHFLVREMANFLLSYLPRTPAVVDHQEQPAAGEQTAGQAAPRYSVASSAPSAPTSSAPPAPSPPPGLLSPARRLWARVRQFMQALEDRWSGPPTVAEAVVEGPRRADVDTIAIINDIGSMAEQSGIGHSFQKIVAAARKQKLHAVPGDGWIKFTPPGKESQLLFVVRARCQTSGRLPLHVEPENFARAYPISGETAMALLGQRKLRHLTPPEVDAFLANLERLFRQIQQRLE
jgi:hypothetical protein